MNVCVSTTPPLLTVTEGFILIDFWTILPVFEPSPIKIISPEFLSFAEFTILLVFAPERFSLSLFIKVPLEDFNKDASDVNRISIPEY